MGPNLSSPVDNALAHSSVVKATKLIELGFQLVPYLRYFPDLAPSEYYIFPNMKK